MKIPNQPTAGKTPDNTLIPLAYSGNQVADSDKFNPGIAKAIISGTAA